MFGRKRPRVAVGIAFMAIGAAFFSQGKNSLAIAFVVLGTVFVVAARRGGDE